jgi:hypothetical protein
MLLVLMFGACATDDGNHDDESQQEQEAVGGLSLSLVSTDSQGRVYRLRNATFTVDSDYYYYYDGGAPPPAKVLSTEDDPDADRLTVRLVPGSYRVSLGGKWYLERMTASGYEIVKQSVLLSEAVQYAYIGDEWNYDLDFRFGVDGTLIDFRHGDLNIDISVELPGENHGYDAGSFPVYDAGVALDAGWL